MSQVKSCVAYEYACLKSLISAFIVGVKVTIEVSEVPSVLQLLQNYNCNLANYDECADNDECA